MGQVAGFEPALNCPSRRAGGIHDPFPMFLCAANCQRAARDVVIFHVEGRSLGAPQAAAIQHCQERGIARTSGSGTAARLVQRTNLAVSQRAPARKI